MPHVPPKLHLHYRESISVKFCIKKTAILERTSLIDYSRVGEYCAPNLNPPPLTLFFSEQKREKSHFLDFHNKKLYFWKNLKREKIQRWTLEHRELEPGEMVFKVSLFQRVILGPFFSFKFRLKMAFSVSFSTIWAFRKKPEPSITLFYQEKIF